MRRKTATAVMATRPWNCSILGVNASTGSVYSSASSFTRYSSTPCARKEGHACHAVVASIVHALNTSMFTYTYIYIMHIDLHVCSSAPLQRQARVVLQLCSVETLRRHTCADSITHTARRRLGITNSIGRSATMLGTTFSMAHRTQIIHCVSTQNMLPGPMSLYHSCIAQSGYNSKLRSIRH